MLTFAARCDYVTEGRMRCPGVGYFPLLCIGYCVGLSLAFLANAMHWTINGVQGQPALLYLVPCTLIPITIQAGTEVARFTHVGM